MKVSYQWLTEYIDLSDYSATDLAEQLTRSGIEVDSVEKRNKGIAQVVVGHVTAKERHPDADKLNVCTVDIGENEPLQIVCGAANVDSGQKVAVAVVGAVLPGDFKIKKAKLRGVESFGMICSAKELGMNDRLLPKEIQEGILVLPSELQTGEDVLEVLGLNDEVMELDLTPNRADCLSMIGTAYEIGAIINREVKLPNASVQESSSASKAVDHIRVKISAEEQCNHYATRLIENIKISTSPLWMQNRLMAAGLRPINNIVDITNYVMLEYGQPLHAFDADRLDHGQIDVRLAAAGEKIVTLDDVERKLEPSMLVITDGPKPIAIAGVMGGANSEVTTATSRILLESANFSGASVRKTSRQLGLRSEASLRFEKEADPQVVIPALNRAAELMVLYAGGQVVEGIVEEKLKEQQQTIIELTMKKVNDYLGTNISLEEVSSIFSRLNFQHEQKSESQSFQVAVPTRRGDISRDVDLIEEIARLYGYDHIPTTLMSGVTTPGSLNKDQVIRRSIRRLLAEIGLHEVVNYSFTHPDKTRLFPGAFDQTKQISLSMPMSEDRAALRTSLIPHLLDNAVYNRNRNHDHIALFEIGHVFLTDELHLTKQPEERSLLSALVSGKRAPSHWSGKEEKVSFYDLKGIIEKLLNYLGIEESSFEASTMTGLHPGRTAIVQVQSTEGIRRVGVIGQLHPTLQDELDLDDTYIMELDLKLLYEHADFAISYQSLPRYPSIGRDMAIVVNESLPAAEVVDKVKETAGALLESIQVFDIFVGERLGANKKSIALSLVYRHADRTLTDEEVSQLHEKVVQQLEADFAAELRK